MDERYTKKGFATGIVTVYSLQSGEDVPYNVKTVGFSVIS
jgi:hypothetical protein